MLKPFIAGSIISGVLLVAACSTEEAGSNGAPPPDTGDAGKVEVTSEAGAANQAQACNTLPRTFDVAPKDYYLVYASDAEAVASLRKYQPKVDWAEPGSDFQKRGEKAVAAVFAAYQKLYPSAVEGMTAPPRVVISSSTAFNAFAYVLPVIPVPAGGRRVPWVFAYNKGFFVPNITDDQIALVAAHEMGHLFLRNGNPAFFQNVYYRETPDEQGKIFGAYEKNEPELEKLTNGVKAIGERVGQAALKELHGVPTRVGHDELPGTLNFTQPLYHRLIANLLRLGQGTSTAPAKCVSGIAAFNRAKAIVEGNLNADSEVVLDAAELAALDTAGKTAGTDLADCLAHLTGTFRGAAVELKKFEDDNYEETIAKLTTDEELDAYLGLSKNEKDADAADPDQNLVTKILALGAKAQEALRLVYSDPTLKYEELREFNFEDDADEAAVRIAKVMGKDAEDLGKGLLILDDPAYVASCYALLDANKVPKYGGAIDPHHGNCWRAYRNRKLKVALQSCPASWPK